MKRHLLLSCIVALGFTFGVVVMAAPGEGEACGKVAKDACKVENPQCSLGWHTRLGLDGETWYCCGQRSYTGRQCKSENPT